MPVRILVAALVVLLVGANATSAIAQPVPIPGWYRVDSEIMVSIFDTRPTPPHHRCPRWGWTTQEVLTTLGGPGTQLGTGRPHFDYPRHRGPFRDPVRPVLFTCGDELSVCFHPSTVSVNPGGWLVVTIEVTFYKGSGLVMPCDPANLAASRVVTIFTDEGEVCLEDVTLTATGGDSVTIERFCASATYLRPVLAGSRPLPVNMIVTTAWR
jgi:hypothetical protein